jgi:hypothetical protein
MSAGLLFESCPLGFCLKVTFVSGFTLFIRKAFHEMYIKISHKTNMHDLFCQAKSSLVARLVNPLREFHVICGLSQFHRTQENLVSLSNPFLLYSFALTICHVALRPNWGIVGGSFN